MSGTFLKYPSIENAYREKHIIQWLRHYPELYDETFLLQEKMHGSNIQFEVHPRGQCFIYSRKQRIGEIDLLSSVWPPQEINFQGADIIEVITNRFDGMTLDLLKRLHTLAMHNQSVIRAYGELCGPRIQKGVYYCDKPTIFFFDISQNGMFLSPFMFYELMQSFRETAVATVAGVRGVWMAVNFDISQAHHIPDGYTDLDNIIEGAVIKPFYTVYQDGPKEIFYLKKKNDAFKEKQKSPKETKPVDAKLVAMNHKFLDYITYNRIESVFSKHGTIQESNQIGDYIKLVIEDALEDFAKDYEHGFNQLNKAERKYVTKAGGTVAQKLKEYL